MNVSKVMSVDKIVMKTLNNMFPNKNISDNAYIYKDLRIYGDDFEELIHSLSKQLNFDMTNFYNQLKLNGFYNPPETYIDLPEFFYIDIGKLLKGQIVYHTLESKGKDIRVGELIHMLEKLSVSHIIHDSPHH